MNSRTKAESEILAGRAVDAVVYVWYPCKRFYFGHASIYIGGVPRYPWTEDFNSEDSSNPVSSYCAGGMRFTTIRNRIRPTDDNYVSFLADPNIQRGILSCAGVFNNLRGDFAVPPHLEYYLIGLDVVKMQHEKNKIYNGKMYGNLQMNHSYNPLNKNCSTMVAKILKAGGVENVLGPGYSMSQCRTPKDVAQLCNKLRDHNMAVKVRGLDCPDKLKIPFRSLMGFR
ncbi:hypothetical protein [Xenorhabdus sp. PB62.4]|uniref:hypothetical protein n=1 Tax=Xenorhabdus sp. PB62.4 TaxID=1851573 RepID=UPI001657382D|nr:hypothetical protein [Xenorhabdus sp. PB62.4]MBC8952153.1 Autotransporter adhesin [Xenorhabdus sp. PB62.4]